MNLLKNSFFKLLNSCFVIHNSSSAGLAPLVIIIAVALVAAAVPTTVILVQQEQDNRQLAQTTGDNTCSPPCPSHKECSNNKCLKKTDAHCDNNKDCASGICIKTRCKQTRNVENEYCGENDDCASGICIKTRCKQTRNGENEYCGENDDCENTLFCIENTCYPQQRGTGGSCGEDTDCQSGICERKLCQNSSVGGDCREDLDCQSGICEEEICQPRYVNVNDRCYRDTQCITQASCITNTSVGHKTCQGGYNAAPTPITDGGKPLCKEYRDDLGIYHSECKSNCDGSINESPLLSHTCNYTGIGYVCCKVKILSDAEKPPTDGSDPTTCEGKYGNGEYACYASGHCRSEGGTFLPGTGTECASIGGCCKFPKGNNGTTPAPPKSSPTTAPIPILVPEKGGWCADGNRQNAKPYPKDTKCNINNSPYNNNKYDAFCHKTFGSPSDFYFECPAANTPIVPGYCTNAAATSNPISINNPTCGLANTDYDSNYDAYCRENYGKNDNQSNYFYKCVAAVDKKPPADECSDRDKMGLGCPCIGTGSSRCGILGNYTCMGPANDQPKDTEACCLVNQRACNDGRCVGQKDDFICGSGTPPTKTPTKAPTQTPVQQDTAVSCLGENPDALTFTKNGLSESLQDRNCTDAKVKSSSSRCCMGNGKCLSDFGGEFTCKVLQNDRGGPFGNCSTLPLCNN